jgi:hypothetical protein
VRGRWIAGVLAVVAALAGDAVVDGRAAARQGAARPGAASGRPRPGCRRVRRGARGGPPGHGPQRGRAGPRAHRRHRWAAGHRGAGDPALPEGWGDQSFPIDKGAVEVGAEGEFVGPGCRGVVCAEFRHPNLLPREPWVFEPNQPEQTVTARPLERVVGTVLDPEGQPVAGAQLVVRRGIDDDPTALPPFTGRSTLSDAEGVFTFARVERPPCDPCGEASGRCEPGQVEEVPTYNATGAGGPGDRVSQRGAAGRAGRRGVGDHAAAAAGAGDRDAADGRDGPIRGRGCSRDLARARTRRTTRG